MQVFFFPGSPKGRGNQGHRKSVVHESNFGYNFFEFWTLNQVTGNSLSA